MLLLRDYRIVYPDGKVLSYPDIDVKKGELTGLFGESGCGKTSLLESLFNPDFVGKTEYRTALFDGQPFSVSDPRNYRKVSYCPQFSQAALNPKLTLKEHLRLTLKGNKLSEDPEKIRNMLESLKLEERMLDRRPGGLSGGQQQRMVLFLCSVKEPKLMVLDEASSAIDLITLKDMVSFLEKMRGKTTILMVAHSKALLDRAADRVIHL